MLIPAKKSGDLLIWHLLCNKHRERISYIEKTGEHERKITVDSLERFRHVVGWCSDATYHAGMSPADDPGVLFLLTLHKQEPPMQVTT